MNTKEILQLLNRSDVKSQLNGIKKAEEEMNSELYMAIKKLNTDYKTNDIVKMAAQKVVKSYDPKNIPSSNDNEDNNSQNSSDEIKFGSDSEETINSKNYGVDSQNETKMLKWVLTSAFLLIFIVVIVSAVLFYKPWSLLNKADKAYNSNKYIMAVSDYEDVIKYNEKSSSFIIENKLESIYFNLIDACLKSKNDDKAVENSFKFIKVFSDDPEISFKVAEILEKNQLDSDALTIYEKIKEYDDNEYSSLAEDKCKQLSSKNLEENSNEDTDVNTEDVF